MVQIDVVFSGATRNSLVVLPVGPRTARGVRPRPAGRGHPDLGRARRHGRLRPARTATGVGRLQIGLRSSHVRRATAAR